jgi:spermidine synthase
MYKRREKLLFYSITALGISSIITQIVLMREFLSVFYGNELILGIILANWLLLTGIGAYIGKFSSKIKAKIRFIIISQVLVAFLPFLSIFLIRALKNIIFPVGSLVSIVQIFVSSFILLLPYCLISGFLLVMFCCVFSLKEDPKSIGKVYFIDNIGDILGGFLFSFVLIYLLNPFQMIFFIMFINLLAALLLSIFIRRNLLRNILIFLIIFSFLFEVIDFNKISTELQYKNQELVFQKNSPYGELVITKTQNQLNFFENGIPLFSTENTVANEETVHYAMVQHSNPKDILLISGGAAGTTNEILKYNISGIDYVELDPLVIKLGREYTNNLENEKINIINKDARLFVKETENKYDIVIIDLPDPSTAQINRFYTIEFFSELKKKLNEDAIVSLSLISTKNYISKEARQLNSVLYNTLKETFDNVIIIPGDRNFFIASDSGLTYDISKKIEEKNITNKYVNEHYLKGELTNERIDYVLDSIDKKVNVNKDFTPITYYYHLLYWLSHFKSNYLIFLSIIFVLTMFFLIRIKPISFAIFTTGFAASSLEIVLLISFQIIYGYVYHMIGLVITMFMLGLAIGSFYMNKKLEKKDVNSFIKIEFLIVIYSILLPFILILLSKTKESSFANQFVFSVITLIIAIIVGMEFPLASKLQFRKISETAAQLYNADLIGACIGALLVSALLIPLIGLINVCIMVGILNLISGLVIIFKRKNYI